MACDHVVGTKALQQAIDKANVALELFVDDIHKMGKRFEWYQSTSMEKATAVNKAEKGFDPSTVAQERKKQIEMEL
jgi:hypothetical protein